MNTKLFFQAFTKFLLGVIILGLLSFIPMFIAALIVKRIRNEETVMEQGLEGYSDYKNRVKYKLIPYIW